MPDTSEAPPKPSIGFHHGAILDALGYTPATIRASLRAHCPEHVPPPSDAAIYQWTSRSRIAQDWLPMCLYAALQSGRLTMRRAFVIRPAPPA